MSPSRESYREITTVEYRKPQSARKQRLLTKPIFFLHYCLVTVSTTGATGRMLRVSPTEAKIRDGFFQYSILPRASARTRAAAATLRSAKRSATTPEFFGCAKWKRDGAGCQVKFVTVYRSVNVRRLAIHSQSVKLSHVPVSGPTRMAPTNLTLRPKKAQKERMETTSVLRYIGVRPRTTQRVRTTNFVPSSSSDSDSSALPASPGDGTSKSSRLQAEH